MRNFLRALATALVLSFCLPALAQYSIASIEIRGGAPYSDAEILSIAGLQPGQLLSQSSLGNAAQHLLDTGLFDDTQVLLGGAGLRRTVIFLAKPTPLSKLFPGSFENFVWFTPAELNAGLRSHVPLYRGYFSDAGNFPDTVQAALQQMLAAKGVTATVSHTIVEPTSEHPQRVMSFRVDSPEVFYGRILLAGIPDALQAETNRLIERIAGRSYNEGLAGVTLDEMLLAPAHNAGYLSAKLTGVERAPTAISGGTSVAYSATMDAGDPYKVSAVTFQPTPLYSAADFAHDAVLHPGDIAASSALAKTEAMALIPYHAQGYIDAYVVAAQQLDTTAHTVAYTLSVNQGEQYKLKSVTATGLSSAAQAEFDSGWRLKAGDVYDESYVKRFLTNNTALRGLDGYAGSYQAVGDPQTHLVDLTVTFVRTGR
jgi:outer membrane protein assembly factor BamA